MGDEFFTAKADTAVSSVSGLDEDFGFINKFDRSASSTRIGRRFLKINADKK
jgi:hypothetical protein